MAPLNTANRAPYHKTHDFGHFLVRALEAEQDYYFTSRKAAIKFAKDRSGLVFDLEHDLVIANYEKR